MPISTGLPIMACSHPMPGCVPRSFRPCRSTRIPLSGRGAPCCSACPPELGPVAQAGVRYPPGTLPRCGGPLKIIAAIEHPPVIAKISPTWACPPGHRPDPRPGPSTDSTSLTSRGSPTPSGSAPEPTASLGLAGPRRENAPKHSAPGPMKDAGSRPSMMLPKNWTPE
jgi:hypothetical protein